MLLLNQIHIHYFYFYKIHFCSVGVLVSSDMMETANMVMPNKQSQTKIAAYEGVTSDEVTP